ncbi:UDP binding domain-containing protein [Dyella sp.]|uniref:UDP binding domain-containing protein n=1 Tax=Dyella sp. TaxID=1869338 RepID=UPI002D794711|nr:UDP binding domain-containing protein [Dyella sp.]
MSFDGLGRLAHSGAGVTSKEDCPDLRNRHATDIVGALAAAHAGMDVHDPRADAEEAERKLGLRPLAAPELGAYDAIVLAVVHRQFPAIDAATIRAWGREACTIFDIKSVPREALADARL